jgi:hypothetical protein
MKVFFLNQNTFPQSRRSSQRLAVLQKSAIYGGFLQLIFVICIVYPWSKKGRRAAFLNLGYSSYTPSVFYSTHSICAFIVPAHQGAE